MSTQFDELRSLINQLADRSDRRERAGLATQAREALAKLEAESATAIPRSILLARAKDAFRRAFSVSPTYRAQMAIQIILNGRWGVCGYCPQDVDGFPHPEECENTDRYDHRIPPNRA